MTNRIENIVIVGGGTAGWLAANYLNRALNRSQPNCTITLIEATDIDTIGVGEATLPTLRQTLSFLGFAEAEWLVECNASFKLGTKFFNWVTKDHIYWVPFQSLSHQARQVTNANLWLKQHLAGDPLPYSHLHENTHLSQAKKAPQSSDYPDYQGAVNYAYHLDAGLFAAYLKKKAKAGGVKHVLDKVVEVDLTEPGFIDHLVTEKSGPLTADLFIDCSGFRGLLINQTLQEPFISFKDVLFCDRAVAMNIPTDDARCGINPYTTSTALQAGWVWHTPLFGRSGNGYVYCSDFISPTAAEAEFRAYLGDVAADLEARHIEMRTGHHRRLWVNNCVSLGLAGGFVEPLESTGIFLIEMALHHLVQNFPDKQFQSVLINRYNRIMTYYYEEVQDFLVLHYCTTQRIDTPFWQANHHHPAIPASLQRRLAQWRTVLPGAEDALEFGPMRDFLPYAYTSILAGTEHLPDQPLPLLAYQPDQAAQTLADIQTEANRLTQTQPDHYEYLCQLHFYEALQGAFRQDKDQLKI